MLNHSGLVGTSTETCDCGTHRLYLFRILRERSMLATFCLTEAEHLTDPGNPDRVHFTFVRKLSET